MLAEVKGNGELSYTASLFSQSERFKVARSRHK